MNYISQARRTKTVVIYTAALIILLWLVAALVLAFVS